ncbi:protein phosphatase 1 regulatory subunit 35 isoform X1 [Arapaima gigas]
MADMDSATFNQMRIRYLDSIAENLSEATELMIQLNCNLQVWAERTGQIDHLAQVWTAFQNRLASLSVAFGDVAEEKLQPGEGPASGSVVGES